MSFLVHQIIYSNVNNILKSNFGVGTKIWAYHLKVIKMDTKCLHWQKYILGNLIFDYLVVIVFIIILSITADIEV